MQTRHPLKSLLVVLGAAALALSGCAAPSGSGDTSSAASSEGAAQTHVVKTDLGEVKVPTAPKRVVVLNYALAGYLYDLDAPVAAVTTESTDSPKEPAEFWKDEANEQGTQYLNWSADGFDLEAILAQKPDLIIAGGLGFPQAQAQKAYKQLSDMAPTVVVSGKFTTWEQQYKFLATDVFAKPQVFQDAKTAYDNRVKEVKSKITAPKGKTSFVTFTGELAPFVLIEDQGLPQMFTQLGFDVDPLFATGKYKPYTAGGDMFELSTEQVGQVMKQENLFVMGFNGPTVDLATLKKQPLWAALPAFKTDAVHELPYWSLRGDYDETMAILDTVEKDFAK